MEATEMKPKKEIDVVIPGMMGAREEEEKKGLLGSYPFPPV